jgi:hypothetical protein
MNQQRHHQHIDQYARGQLHAGVPGDGDTPRIDRQCGTRQVDAGQQQMRQTLMRSEHGKADGYSSAAKKRSGDRQAVEIEVAQRLPVGLGEALHAAITVVNIATQASSDWA